MQPNEFAQERKSTVRGSELAASMAAAMSTHLRKSGIEETLADRLSLDVLDEIRKQYGGQTVYFAQDKHTKLSELHDTIYDRFCANEITIPRIAQEYGFSLQWAYHIIKTVRTRRREAREADRASVRQRDVERWKREGGAGNGA
jgi:Mor family transcriptional regulator